MSVVLKDAAFPLSTHIDLGHSVWVQRIPFPATVLQVQRLRMFVELGVDVGNFYFADFSTVARYGSAPGLADVSNRAVAHGKDVAMPKHFPQEFNSGVVAVARSSVLTQAQVARDFGISENSVARWVKPAR
jgi:hypothetical protein